MQFFPRHRYRLTRSKCFYSASDFLVPSFIQRGVAFLQAVEQTICESGAFINGQSQCPLQYLGDIRTHAHILRCAPNFTLAETEAAPFDAAPRLCFQFYSANSMVIVAPPIDAMMALSFTGLCESLVTHSVCLSFSEVISTL